MKKFLVICLLATVTLAYADNSKLSPDLQASKASHAVVIVQYNQQPGLLDLANLTNLLGTILSDLPLVNGIVADLPEKRAMGCSSSGGVGSQLGPPRLVVQPGRGFGREHVPHPSPW